MATTLFDKIYDSHVAGRRRIDGKDLVYMDRNMTHELHAPIAMGKLRDKGRSVRRSDLTISMIDHSVSARRAVEDIPETVFVTGSRERSRDFGVRVFDVGEPQQGISHVVAPERGIALPGSTYTCPDSHACTVGGIGALAFATGTTELEHVLATQVLAMMRPKRMRIRLTGRLGDGATAKDVVLKIIAECGVSVGRGYAIEYAGPVVEAMPIEGRLTICNMAIEMGGRTGLIAPDDATFEWLAGRPAAPEGSEWEAALATWRRLPTDAGAAFDREIEVDCDGLEPLISWGTDPGQVIPISGRVPDPSSAPAEQRAALEKALAYMDLVPGTAIEGLPVDRVFIGSCTNSRLPDLEAAAAILKGRKVAEGVKATVVPGSSEVKRQAEAKGLDAIFRDAGFFWGESGCSMCAGGFRDKGQPGERCVSTTNRNFENRQGRGVRTHLVSPPMAAAAAVTGRISDLRRLESEQ